MGILANLLQSNRVMLHPVMRLYYKYKFGTKGIVYMLHRVGDLDKNGIPINENMKVSPQCLEKIIVSYRKQGFDFLSVDELYQVLIKEKPQHKPFVVFTLDDGYVDNYTKAYPIFKKHQVPFCVYVTTGFPDSKVFLWWYALEDYIQQAKRRKEDFEALRKQILTFSQEGFVNQFRQLTTDFDVDVQKYVQAASMSWAQIEEMSEDSLCTIGGHTVSHPAFTALTEQEIRKEIEEGVRKLESHLGKRISHFAYPYGGLSEVNDREYKITETYGFKTIMTTLAGGVTVSTNRNRIPRYMLFDDNYLR